jgi:hypothetical protein
MMLVQSEKVVVCGVNNVCVVKEEGVGGDTAQLFRHSASVDGLNDFPWGSRDSNGRSPEISVRDYLKKQRVTISKSL